MNHKLPLLSDATSKRRPALLRSFILYTSVESSSRSGWATFPPIFRASHDPSVTIYLLRKSQNYWVWYQAEYPPFDSSCCLFKLFAYKTGDDQKGYYAAILWVLFPLFMNAPVRSFLDAVGCLPLEFVGTAMMMKRHPMDDEDMLNHDNDGIMALW